MRRAFARFHFQLLVALELQAWREEALAEDTDLVLDLSPFPNPTLACGLRGPLRVLQHLWVSTAGSMMPRMRALRTVSGAR